MRPSSRSARSLLVAAAGLPLLLGACSSSSGTPAPADTTPPPVDAGVSGGDATGGNGSAPPSAVTGPSALPSLSKIKVRFSVRSTKLTEPTHVTGAADGTSRLFITERAGRIRVYTGSGHLQSAAYLDIRGRVRSDTGERGLLGLAFRPDFGAHHQLWVSYTDRNGALQISRFGARTAHSSTVSASTEVKVLTIPHPVHPNHNGGMLAFGKDGYLYVGTGDGGGGGDPDNNAQDKTSLLGKILRIDVKRSCASRAYCVPPSNPYATSSKNRRQIWVVGVRNPWRFSFDRATGDLWIGDVGQDAYEEVDRVPAGSGGRNLGWPCREASHVYDASRCRSGVAYRAPVVTYAHALGEAVTGGYVYRGKTYGSLLAGRYVFGDYVSGRVWVRTASGSLRQMTTLPNVASFGTSAGGEIYAVTLDGGLYALTASTA